MENAMVTSWFDSHNRRDWEAMAKLYAHDALIHSKEGPQKGGGAVAKIAERWVEAMPDAKITALHISEEEKGLVVAHWRAEGTLSGSIGDIAATGKKTSFHGHTCFRCDGNQVVEHWACVDYRPLQAASVG